MDQTRPHQTNRTGKDFYLTMAPKRTRTFSEYMVQRRQPFLCSETSSNPPFPIAIAKSSSKEFKEQPKPKDSEVEHSLRTFDYKYQNSNNNNGIKLPNSLKASYPVVSCENKQTINKKSEHGINYDGEMKNWVNIKNDTKKMEKTVKWNLTTNYKGQVEMNGMFTHFSEDKENLKTSRTILGKRTKTYIGESITEIKRPNNNSVNSETGYYSGETSSILDSETSFEDFIYSEDLNPLTNSTFICQNEISATETSYSSNEIGNETFLVNTAQNNGNHINEDSHLVKNIHLPSIIVNDEVDIIEQDFKKQFEMENFNYLKIPMISKISEYVPNEGLQKKLEQDELFGHIEIKDEVMTQLLEMSQTTDFPKLKHICNMDCDKDSDGLCKKIEKSAEDNSKHREQHKGVFKYMWSTLKYRFVSNSTITEKKLDVPKIENNMGNIENTNKAAEVSKKKQNKSEEHFECVNLEQGEQKPIDAEKQQNLNEILDDTEIAKGNKLEVEQLKQSKKEVQKFTTEQMGNNLTNKEDRNFIDFEKGETNKYKKEIKNIEDKQQMVGKESKDILNKTSNLINETEIDTNINAFKGNQKCNYKPEREPEPADIPSVKQIKKDEKEHIKLVMTLYYPKDMIPKKNEVKSKLKQLYSNIFKRANNIENEQNKDEGRSLDFKIIECMQQKLKKIEKIAKNRISEEAMKRLGNYMAQTKRHQSLDSNAKGKGSGNI